MKIPYTPPTACYIPIDPGIRRLIRELAAEQRAGTVQHPAPVAPARDEEYRVGLDWLREPQPRLF